MGEPTTRWIGAVSAQPLQDAELIVAINTDARAPIFDYTCYGVVAVLFEIVPALARRVKA